MIKQIAMLAAAVFSMGIAHSDELSSPMNATAIPLGDHTAVVYYTEQGDEYEVVTTIGPNYDVEGSIVRHVTRVQAGESFDIEIARNGTYSDPRTITISRNGDALMVATGGFPQLAHYE